MLRQVAEPKSRSPAFLPAIAAEVPSGAALAFAASGGGDGPAQAAAGWLRGTMIPLARRTQSTSSVVGTIAKDS